MAVISFGNEQFSIRFFRFNVFSEMQHVLARNRAIEPGCDVEVRAQTGLGGHAEPTGLIGSVAFFKNLCFVETMTGDQIGLEDLQKINLFAGIIQYGPAYVIIIAGGSTRLRLDPIQVPFGIESFGELKPGLSTDSFANGRIAVE